MSTFFPKIAEGDRKWYVLDARGQVLGKLATAAAEILSGKRKAIYTPFLDAGDHVIIINAGEVHLTGRKESDKLYRYHTGHLGNLKQAAAKDLRSRRPTRIIEEAVRGMLPKTKLGRAMFTKLRVYAGATHRHQAQKPQALAIQKEIRG